jgi:hypothetical protein
VLWLLQDSFVATGPTRTLHAAAFGHNAAVLQDGLCFRVVRGPRSVSFLGGAAERRLRHWFWPLDGELGADGNLHVFVAEFVNPRGTGAADGATPIAVWRAVIRPADLAVLQLAPAADPGTKPLYGFSVTSDDQWSYLYGSCYRQFTDPTSFGSFDRTCNLDVFVARVPRGRFDLAPAYWDGSAWVADRHAAVSVSHAGGFAHPLQVERLADGRFVGASHVDDWWGTSVSMYVANQPTGPFRKYAEVPVPPRCARGCNTYGAAFTPWETGPGRQLVVSSFTWDLRQADRAPVLYRPFFVDVPVPALVESATRFGAR